MPAIGLSARDDEHTNTTIAIIVGVLGGFLALVIVGGITWYIVRRAKSCGGQRSIEPFPYENWRKNMNVAEVNRPLMPDEAIEEKDEPFDPNKMVTRSWTMSTTYSKSLAYDEVDLPFLPSPAPYLVSPVSVHTRSPPPLSRRSYDSHPSINTDTLSSSHPPSSYSRSGSLSPKSLPRLSIPDAITLGPSGSAPLILPSAQQTRTVLSPNRPPSSMSVHSMSAIRHPLPLPPGAMDPTQVLVPNRPLSMVSMTESVQSDPSNTAPALSERAPSLAFCSKQFMSARRSSS